MASQMVFLLAFIATTDLITAQNDRCDSSPCLNGGTCVPLGLDGFTCVCPPAITGFLCETDIPCYPGCQNLGVCEGEPPVCHCRDGYTGQNCEWPIPCVPICQNGGECVDGECECPPLFTGPQCETSIPCFPGCLNGGSCNGQTCDCPPGYTGDRCQTEVGCFPGCFNEGVCYGDTCVCDPGYTGEHCESKIGPGHGYDCNINNPCTPENMDNGHYRFPYAGDCSKYVECAPGPECFIRDCPALLIWNPYEDACTNPTDEWPCYPPSLGRRVRTKNGQQWTPHRQTSKH